MVFKTVKGATHYLGASMTGVSSMQGRNFSSFVADNR